MGWVVGVRVCACVSIVNHSWKIEAPQNGAYKRKVWQTNTAIFRGLLGKLWIFRILAIICYRNMFKQYKEHPISLKHIFCKSKHLQFWKLWKFRAPTFLKSVEFKMMEVFEFETLKIWPKAILEYHMGRPYWKALLEGPIGKAPLEGPIGMAYAADFEILKF